jgi:hypothetical protein
MSTKTIRLPQDLKDRVAAGFHEVAEKRYSRIAGRKARRPVGKKLAR